MGRGRTSPDTLCSGQDGKRKLDILVSHDLFVVVYRGQFFAARSTGTREGDVQYGRVAFPHIGHAIRLMNKLNRLFDTDEFSVEPVRPK